MTTSDRLKDLAHQANRIALKHTSSCEAIELGVDGLYIFRQDHCTTFEALTYDPVFCLIIQGRKETTIGERTVTSGDGDSLIVTHDLPVTSRMLEASPAKPYLALILSLDLGIIRGFDSEIENAPVPEHTLPSFGIHKSDEALIDAFGRYLALVDNPHEAKVLGPLIKQEIHYRLLMAPHGVMLRKLRTLDSRESRIRKAVREIRQNYKSPLAVGDLARLAGMSPSSFHEHFKTVTETSPLQYQKHLRLMEARRLMAQEAYSVATAAYDVGYESLNQFSREYARKFGSSPRDDLKAVLSSG